MTAERALAGPRGDRFAPPGAALWWAVGLAVLAAAGWWSGAPAVAAVLAVTAGLAAGFSWVDAGPGGATYVATVGVLAAAAATARIVLAPVPSVEGLTLVAAASGVAFGPRAGFAVGALAAFGSNLPLGQGPWTPWQMAGFGLCGLASGLVGRRLLGAGRLAWALWLGLCGLGYDALINVWGYTALVSEHTWSGYVAYTTVGAPFTVTHVVSNGVLAAAAGPALCVVLGRFGARIRARVVAAPVPSEPVGVAPDTVVAR